jgi:hypothetical protein
MGGSGRAGVAAGFSTTFTDPPSRSTWRWVHSIIPTTSFK